MGGLDLGALVLPAPVGDPLRPLEVKRATDQVFERLVTAFALGLYPPGHRLPAERDLADRLGVSRMTLREALARLDELGYVEVRRGRYGGTFVTDQWPASSAAVVRGALAPRWAQLEELFDVSRELTPVLARLAAARRTDDDLARLHRARLDYESATGREEARSADRAFHGSVVLAAHNSILVAAAEQLRDRLTLGVDTFPYSAHIHAQAVREHAEVVDAIASGDGARAGELLVAHFVDLVETPFRSLYERAADG